MRTLALDPTTGDLAVALGRLQVASGGEAIRTHLQVRLRFWQGECPSDTSVGIPYLSFLGQKGTETLAESTFRSAILTSPGIVALDTFSFVVGAARRAVLAFRARATSGGVLTFTDFVPGES